MSGIGSACFEGPGSRALVLTRAGFRALFASLLLSGCAGNGVQEHADSSAIELEELADGVWLHTSQYEYPGGGRFSSNGLLVQEGRTLTLIDTAWGELRTLDLLAAIASETGLPVTRAIVTHFHGDRVSGTDILEGQGIEVYAHPLTQRLTIAHGLPVPDRTLEGLARREAAAHFGNLEVIYPGPAHAMDNLMIWLPEQRILFGGCALRERRSTSLGNTTHGDIRSWHKVLEWLADRYESAEIVVPGHGEPGSFEIVQHTHRLVRDALEREDGL